MTPIHTRHLEFIISNSSGVTSHLYKKELSIQQTFCLGIIERLYHSSKSIKALLDNIDLEPSHEYSIGIIIRALILDTLTGMNLFKIHCDSERQRDSAEVTYEKATNFCEVSLSDGLSQTISYLLEAEKNSFIDTIELNQVFKKLVETKSHFFEPYKYDGSVPKLIHKKYYSPQKLFRILANDKNMIRIASIYDTYLYFSKYDHFGIMYFEIIRNNKKEKQKAYLEAFEILVAHLTFLNVILLKENNKDEFLRQSSSCANKYFESMLIEKE